MIHINIICVGKIKEKYLKMLSRNILKDYQNIASLVL